MQGEAEFKREVTLLSQIRHRNIVSIVGYAQEGKECCIVLPYLAQGSLQQLLFGTAERPRERKQQLAFSALDRVGACLDIANGLACLHALSPPVWHLDLKPDNVMRADASSGGHFQLIDFGLARRANDMNAGKTHVTVSTVGGTWGFISDELNAGHQSASCDVYSLGVLILVTVTGLCVFTDGEHLKERVTETLDDLKQRGGDPASLLLASELVVSSCDWSFTGGAEMLLQMLGIGVACCSTKRRRPALADVLHRLQTCLHNITKQLRECLICMSEPRTTVLMPCRHSVACSPCALSLTSMHAACPVCRTPVARVVPSNGHVLQTFQHRLE